MTGYIVDASGVRHAPEPDQVRRHVTVQSFFRLDVFESSGAVATAIVAELGLDPQEAAWALRFGQSGRMQIARDRLRVSTRMADPQGNLIEVHLVGCGRTLLTIWSGDPRALDEIRDQFSQRAVGFESNIFHSAAILLQLLLGALDAALHGIDHALDELRLDIDYSNGAANFAALARRLQRLQWIAASFDRYAGVARSATVGIQSAPGVNERAAIELDDYVEQVEDVSQQFYERRRAMSDLMHDYATGLPQRQGEQINRLTVVSMIFLPVTAVTGFFGMNFDWLNRIISSEEAFLEFGVALPAVMMIVTVAWLWRRGLFRFERSRPEFTLALDRNLPARPLRAETSDWAKADNL
jgi:Mg2+ and Co2+ transporter CorA